jgi:glycosyltransferase involved in cell wall biosynthesis
MNMFSTLPNQIEVNFQLTYLNNSSFHRLLSSHEFLIIPYKPENKSSSGPLIQGLLSGIIPIVSNYGERGRIVNEHASGITFEYTENSLKKALHRALHLPEKEKRKMVLQNKNLSNTFSWSAIFKEYTKAYVSWSGTDLFKK